MRNDGEIVISADGSPTLISPHFQTSYHSLNGSVTESEVVFIQGGLDYQKERKIKDIRVFEMGFGTGLNALLSLKWAKDHCINLEYHSIEAYPISQSLADQLNYGMMYDLSHAFGSMHQAAWNNSIKISPEFVLFKHLAKLEDFESSVKFDVIFYDAFAPADQPNMWDEYMMTKMYNMLMNEGILVSYCAKGSFKRALKSSGFLVENLPGPPGKREITRAIKCTPPKF